MPDWWPKIAWPWFVFVGCVVTLAISVLFRTPQSQIAAAKAHVAQTAAPVAMAAGPESLGLE
jgi:hypothetical protein